jgi:hypothetical protein
MSLFNFRLRRRRAGSLEADFANANGCALSADSKWRSILARPAFSATFAVAGLLQRIEIRTLPDFPIIVKAQIGVLSLTHGNDLGKCGV